jgi:hypothetical protein
MVNILFIWPSFLFNISFNYTKFWQFQSAHLTRVRIKIFILKKLNLIKSLSMYIIVSANVRQWRHLESGLNWKGLFLNERYCCSILLKDHDGFFTLIYEVVKQHVVCTLFDKPICKNLKFWEFPFTSKFVSLLKHFFTKNKR